MHYFTSDGLESSQRRSAEAGFKPLHSAMLKIRGVERWRKGGAGHHQVGDEKMIEREPLVTHRKHRDAIKTGVDLRLPEKHGHYLLTVYAAVGVQVV